MSKIAMLRPFPILIFLFCFLVITLNATALDDEDVPFMGPLVKKQHRRSLVSTEYGEISAVEISDGVRGSYHLQFITLEPNALFLPVILHADMVFYVHSGSGRLSWAAEDEMRRVRLRQGDVYRLTPGTVFFVQSNLEPERQKLRINALFANSDDDLHQPSVGAYSSVRDLVLGFDRRVLQASFKVPEELIREITQGTKQPAIVHGVPKKARTFWEWEAQLMKGIIGSKGYSMFDINNKKEKTRTFNILSADPDFKNCNGWSLIVTKKDLNALRGSNIGVFMVNLTKGSMMGPHWNPTATEITTVVKGQGMIRVVCPSTAKESECKNMRFRVEEGDVFVVPRFHPMAQMSFNNDSLVLVGFSTTTKKNHPQFLAGKSSVLQTLDKQILAVSFNVPNTTIEQLLAPQGESIILDCTSCAEEEEKAMEEEIEKEREEEEARRREEEKRREEEEEARKREEEEARKREEEKRRREEEEEARRREEEEAKKREEEKRRQEEEEARRREEEEAKEREEEEAKEREEEEARRREEEARKREEEEASRREEEEARREEEEREEEEAKRRQEEAARREEEEARRREEEEARRREEEEARREEEEEEEARRREEEEARREEEEIEKEARRKEEKAKTLQEEAATRREEEEAQAREQEEEARIREEEKARKREAQREQEREWRRQEAAQREEQEARQREEEQRQAAEEARKRKQEREEEAREREERGRGEGPGEEGRRVLKKIWKV
ncbi:vicilin-like seed storage protein At2g18540 [Cornus florida]|uniref:vicilin-like seed storage protein At2g18540 n=1 Tax=Cornus florida TaxID=4283 RepID=UPI00289A86C3|nr:vicilin-like seed storage protein At2g18540 [Cornus florida]